LSAVIGSWKIIATRRPDVAQRRLAQRRQAPRPPADTPAAIVTCGGSSPHDRLCRHRLARPGLRDDAEDLVARHGEAELGHRMRAVGAARQRDGEAVDVENRCFRHARPCGRAAG